ncbi:glycoside hydrolase family 19 protein [Streptomyces sp. NPDC056486]|uniref:glycoside hydrolase family 19 protein n=1 Tax=Streptomyces sp. NPDC056486 TaxID=3345835 RepID=UPI00369B01BA
MIVLGPAATTASAAACATPWNSSSVYTGGNSASYNGHNWTAKWWTQNETPGRTDVWADAGTCGGGTDPGNPNPSGFVVSEAQFNQMFPSRNSFYTYKGLTDALKAYPAFANTGSDTIKRQEAAAFLANVHHETGGLVHIVEQNQANYPHYCDANQPYGCPAGQAAYYGRGPIQLSWNFNYKAAGDALGIDLLRNPYLVERDPAVAWKTGLWYWNTQSGPGTMTPHNAMVNSRGFGETIRAINGSLECNGGNPGQVQSRVDRYKQFAQVLGTTPGSNLSC